MSFLYPAFLWALAALAIPIIIHLFNFRRFKTVYFTNVKFLKELKEETASRSKVKHLLVLLMRLFAIAFLVLAFAQPFIANKQKDVMQGGKAVSIYIDNSFSMDGLSDEVSLLDKAKLKAEEIAAAYQESDQFQLLTNEFDGAQQRLLSKEEFLANLKEVRINPNTRTLNKIFGRQKQALDNSRFNNKIAYQVSDFQENIIDYENDTSFQVNFLPLAATTPKNVFIDSVWFNTPVQFLNQPQQLLFKLKNISGSDVVNAKITLRINDKVKAIGDYTVNANSETIDTLNFAIKAVGWHRCELFITDFPITFDDAHFFTFNVKEQVSMLAINQKGDSKYLNALFENNDYFKLVNNSTAQVDYAKLSGYQLIVLNNLNSISSGLAYELQQYVNNGGSLLVFPSKSMDAQSYQSLTSALSIDAYGDKNETAQAVGSVNLQHQLFKDVFTGNNKNMAKPSANFAFNFVKTARLREVLMRFKNGESFINAYNYGSGKAYLCASPLDKEATDLPINALFVPMVYKMVMLGGSNTKQLAYTIGKDEVIEIDRLNAQLDELFKLTGDGNQFIPQQTKAGAKMILGFNGQLQQAGFYELSSENTAESAWFGFNYDRTESILSYLSSEDLQAELQADNVNIIEDANVNLAGVIGTLNEGIPLWKVCIIFVLVFLGLEILLLKLWK